jgi:hypothetical protein
MQDLMKPLEGREGNISDLDPCLSLKSPGTITKKCYLCGSTETPVWMSSCWGNRVLYYFLPSPKAYACYIHFNYVCQRWMSLQLKWIRTAHHFLYQYWKFNIIKAKSALKLDHKNFTLTLAVVVIIYYRRFQIFWNEIHICTFRFHLFFCIKFTLRKAYKVFFLATTQILVKTYFLIIICMNFRIYNWVWSDLLFNNLLVKIFSN